MINNLKRDFKMNSNTSNNQIEAAKIYFEKGLQEYEKENYLFAIDNYKKSLEIVPDRLSTLNNLIASFLKIGQLKSANYYINIGLTIDKNDDVLLLNEGVYNLKVKNLDSALISFKKAIFVNPLYCEAYSNIGFVYELLNDSIKAMQSYNKTLDINPYFIEALYKRGNLFAKLGDNIKALSDFNRGLEINPNYQDLLACYMGAKMQVCNWESYYSDKELIKLNILKNNIVTPPFRLLSLFDCPKLHLMTAENYANEEIPYDNILGNINFTSSNTKIKIGYFSADFHNHATSYLMAEIFELHNCDKFEIYAFSYGPNYDDQMRKRLKDAFYKFIDVTDMSDLEIASLVRQLNINIAIDLKGYTGGQRCGIFSKRCAPIQINYLGYPGTMGSELYDYIIADKVLISENEFDNYSEKIILLPNCYQPNDSNKIISDSKTTKGDFNLPLDSFVFCSFNNTYKIQPDLFKIWMNILFKKPNSVLWLIDDNPIAVSNLKNFADKNRVNPDRIIFAKRTILSEHLARHKHADLFLDTFPYNAHTTASDSLWAGLPVLTCKGNSFASRVAASLLNSCGLSDFITNTFDEYESRAIELSNNPELILKAKNHLNLNKFILPLFDAKLYVKNIETAYTLIYENYLNGISPNHIYVD